MDQLKCAEIQLCIALYAQTIMVWRGFYVTLFSSGFEIGAPPWKRTTLQVLIVAEKVATKPEADPEIEEEPAPG